MDTQELLVSYARQIAVYRGHDTINGLQPLPVLIEKQAREMEELQEAQRTKSRLHVYHEAADVLYYAACLEAARPDHLEWQYGRAWLARHGIDLEKAEQAALAKYEWRSGAPDRKDEAYELRLIAEAIGEEL